MFLRIRKSDWAGSSFALHSLPIEGQIVSLNSVVVKKLGFSISISIEGRTLTEREVIFIALSNKGITFLTKAFLSNFSKIFDIPFKN